MSSSANHDDLEPEQTEGFKVGEKKTMDEYQNLDKEDDAMVRWKESLGLATGKDISNPKDPRKVILFSLGLESAGRPDIVIDLTKPGALEALKTKPFVIKEGVTFNMIATFQVQHEILAGMKYVQVVKRGPLHHKMQEMIGSFPPNTEDKRVYTKKFEPETAPSGMLGRGTYEAVSRFTDDDKHTHLEFKWSFEVRKQWADA